MFPKAPEMSPTCLCPWTIPGSWVGWLLIQLDFGDVIVLRERVQVSVEVLHSACGLWMLLSGPSPSVASPGHLLKGHLGWGPLVEVAPQLLLLVLLDFPHHLQEFLPCLCPFSSSAGSRPSLGLLSRLGVPFGPAHSVHAAHLRIRILNDKSGGVCFLKWKFWDSICFSAVDPGEVLLCGLIQMNADEHSAAGSGA